MSGSGGVLVSQKVTSGPSQRPVSALRARMIENMTVRGLTVAHRACVFQTMIFRSYERALRLPCKGHAFSNWKGQDVWQGDGHFIRSAEALSLFGLRLEWPESGS